MPLLPTEALIATGADSRVIVQDPDGSFRPVRVRTGRSGDGRTEILAGLAGGERVVVSGQFLIDSEASLSGALERLGNRPVVVPREATVMPGGKPTASATTEKTMSDMSPSQREKRGVPARDQPSAAPQSRSCSVQYWYDPMVPDKHFDRPGKSPFMDMQLVPKFAPGADPKCTIHDVKQTDPDVQP